MTEQGLKAVVYPELDEQGMREFIRQISDMLGDTSIPIGANVVTNQSTASVTNTSTTSTANNNDSSVVNINSEDVGKGIKDGLKQSSDDTETHEKIQAPTRLSLSSILASIGGVAGAVGVGAIGVATTTAGIFKFLESASPPLKNVMDLFTQAFNLIWMPIGTLLAVKLMPFLQKTFARVGDFIASAMTIYEEKGWAGVIEEAIKTSLDVLISLLSDTEFLEVIFTALFTLWDRLNPTQLLLSAVFGTDGPIIGIKDFVDMIATNVSMLWHLITGDWDALGKDFENLMSIDKRIVDNLIEQLGKIWDRWGPIIEKISPFKEIIGISKAVDELVSSITGKSIGEHFETWGGNIESGWDKMTGGDFWGGAGEIAKETTPLGQLGKALGWWADGGIITQPTLGVAGEAGPEAIIPLSQLHQVANDYRTITGNVTGGNVMNFYINGNNAQDIGEEVQRILEKTVGKASSKMMWW